MGQITNQSHINKWRLWEWLLYLHFSKNLTAINTNVPHQLIQVTVFFPRTKHHDHPIHGFILQTNPFQNLCLLKPPSWEWPTMNFFIKCFKKENQITYLLFSKHIKTLVCTMIRSTVRWWQCYSTPSSEWSSGTSTSCIPCAQRGW